MHISCVRGSPLIRTVFFFLALVVSGIGFARLTERGAKVTERIGGAGLPEAEKSVVSAKYFLTLSSEPSSVLLGETSIEPQASAEFSGSLELEKDSPVVFLKVEWKEGTGSRRFAKLVIEAPGEETFSHVFDAPGDIDNFVELPF